MTVRKAMAGDLDAILAIYSAARRFMKEHANPDQWGDVHPPEALVREDIALGRNYVLLDGQTLVGVFAFIMGEDPTYIHIENGAWLDSSPYGTIHRLAGSAAARGVFTEALRFCMSICPHIRIDTHEANLIMQRHLEQAGFVKCGIIYVGDGTPRLAYELPAPMRAAK